MEFLQLNLIFLFFFYLRFNVDFTNNLFLFCLFNKTLFFPHFFLEWKILNRQLIFRRFAICSFSFDGFPSPFLFTFLMETWLRKIIPLFFRMVRNSSHAETVHKTYKLCYTKTIWQHWPPLNATIHRLQSSS